MIAAPPRIDAPRKPRIEREGDTEAPDVLTERQRAA